MSDQHLQRRVDERNAARRRQRTVTRLVAVAATGLAAVFAGLSAQKATARKSSTTNTTPATTTSTGIPAAPSLGAAPAAPAQTPVVTSSPPVAVSGGS